MSEDREIVLSRTFDAPRELVFEAWTTVEHLSQWFGPDGFTTTTYAMDFRPGGSWKYMMHGPDGTDYPNLITYKEIVPPERIVFEHGDFDSVQARVTVTLEESDGKTLFTQKMVFDTKEAKDAVVAFGAVELGNQTFARLGTYLKERS
jgi:uncharacterized protein YndB with AHSA1/START domain